MQQAGPSRSPRPTIKLEQGTVERFRPAKLFRDAIDQRSPWTSTAFEGYSTTAQITSIDFDDSGEQCVTASEDEAFVLWDTVKGTKRKTFYSKKYGISLVRFTHGRSNVIHTSTKGDHDIRYHSMHDNKYLCYFKGHTARVRSMHLHPTLDQFISAGDDGTVRLWDLRNPSCKGLVNNVGGSTIAAFDNSGTVFAVACSETQTVMLYGTTTPDAAPFFHASLVDAELAKISQPPRSPLFTSLSFSNNGDFLLVTTSSHVHYILDAYTLAIHRRLEGHIGLETDLRGGVELQPRRGGSGSEAGWTSDSQWVYSGSADGAICFWDMAPHPKVPEEEQHMIPSTPPTLQPTVRLKHAELGKAGPSRAVSFNPRYGMFAVGGSELSFWLPKNEVKDD